MIFINFLKNDRTNKNYIKTFFNGLKFKSIVLEFITLESCAEHKNLLNIHLLYASEKVSLHSFSFSRSPRKNPHRSE